MGPGLLHHYRWMVVVILAVLGARPWHDRPRRIAAVFLWAWFTCRLPWWGITWIAQDRPVQPFGRFLQNADLAGALLALGLLSWSLRRSD